MIEAPVALPEFGIDQFSWAMCRNPMCSHFGVHYDPQDPDYPNSRNDRHYLVKSPAGEMVCRYCGQTFTTKSNNALRPVARYFHSLSLPFVTCPNRDCGNHGVNVFENHAETGSGYRRYYRKEKGEHAVRCRLCEQPVTLGQALNLSRQEHDDDTLWRMADYLLVGAKKRRIIVRLKMRSQTYFNRLGRIGHRVGDYQAWLNARMLSPTLHTRLDFGPVARVYTDVMDATLRRRGNVHGHRMLKIIVSVLAIEKSYFILAAHPYFLPNKLFGPLPEDSHIDAETGGPSADFKARWDCLEHPVHNELKGFAPGKAQKEQADVSRAKHGFYIRWTYAETAHFLVVRKMLSRFKRICFYIDGSRSLTQSAMVGLADAIKTQQVEVVACQRTKKNSKAAREDKLREMGRIGGVKRMWWLEHCWSNTEHEASKKITGQDEPNMEQNVVAEFPQEAAKAFRVATRGACSKPGSWAWLRFPDAFYTGEQYRTLWLTRRAGKAFDDAKDFLVYSTLQPVDSAINSIRNRVRGADRPENRARKGRSMEERYYDPLNVLAELNLYTLDRNYFITQPDQQFIPSDALGLTPMRTPVLDPAEATLQFRLGLSHAQTISEWRRR